MEEDIKVIRKTLSQYKDVISILEDIIMFRLPSTLFIKWLLSNCNQKSFFKVVLLEDLQLFNGLITLWTM